MKVAIVHYWLVGRRGGERVVEALCRLYPQADIFTNVLDPEPFVTTLAGHAIRTTFVNRLPAAARMLPAYLPLMPLALEQIDLRSYDLVISSESGPAKGVIVRPDAFHVCYCYSPMRYVWDLYPHYLQAAGPFRRLMMRPLMHYLRLWDQLSAQRPDVIIADSVHAKRRITKYWRRESEVIHPPVDTARFIAASAHIRPGSYYLCAGQLESYKRVDLAVTAFAELALPLVVVGDGPELAALRSRATSNVSFMTGVSDEAFADVVAGCRALVFPGEEDFGIVPVEAMAAGRPVIAFARGGVVDTVVEGVTGLFFQSQSTAALVDAVRRFEREYERFDAKTIAAHAEAFDERHFLTRFDEYVTAQMRAHSDTALLAPITPG